MAIRAAKISELNALLDIDRSISAELNRAELLGRSIDAGTCFVYDAGEIEGYLVFSHSFFEQGFISLCVVRSVAQRKGIGTALFRHAEALCKSAKIFSSTNESNRRMRNLFVRLGYKESGKVENLDPGDPEIFYFKQLRR